MVRTLKQYPEAITMGLLQFVLLMLGMMFIIPVFAQTPPNPGCTITTVPTSGQGMVDVTVNWTTTDCASATASGAWAGPKLCGSGSQTFNDITQSRTYNLTIRAATGKFGLKWTKPIKNTDDTLIAPMTITGFKLYRATTAAGVPTATPMSLGPDVLEHVEYRAPGPYSGGVRAIRSDNVDSAMSNIITKTVTAAQDTCAATVTITSRPKAPTLSALIDKVTAWFKT